MTDVGPLECQKEAPLALDSCGNVTGSHAEKQQQRRLPPRQQVALRARAECCNILWPICAPGREEPANVTSDDLANEMLKPIIQECVIFYRSADCCETQCE